MVGWNEDNSGRKFILIDMDPTFFTFSIMYGMKGKGRKGEVAKEMQNYTWRKNIQDINKLDDIEKKICIEEVVKSIFGETVYD